MDASIDEQDKQTDNGNGSPQQLNHPPPCSAVTMQRLRLSQARFSHPNLTSCRVANCPGAASLVN